VKVLLVDDDCSRADALAHRITEGGAHTIARPFRGQRLIDAVAEHAPDVIIMDMARPDRDSLDGLREASRHRPLPVVMFVDEDDPKLMEEAIEAGVSSYNLIGSALPDVRPIVHAAVAIFQRYQKVQGALSEAEARLTERKLIEEAKRLLMQERRMAEPQAHRWLRQNAMNRGKRMVEIAAEIIQSAKKDKS
jgi:response regulator NasT